mmetsp:Transcript_4394/g.15758  ORF Transcript_4394/g.15758 Transcript_4394/m.15758 type:complete len:442 (+) Transcript_4394:344-1669(+)
MVMERTSTVEDLLDTFWKIDPDGANSQGTGLESPKTQQQQDQLLMLQQQRAAPTSPRQHRSPHPAQHQHLAHPRYVAAGPGAHPPPHQHLPQPHQYRANPSAAMHQYNYAPHGSVYVEPPAGDPRLSSPKVEGDALHYRGEAVSFGRAGASGKGAPAPPPPQRPQQPQDPGYPLPYDRNMSLKQHQAAISRQEQALAASLSTACQMVAARGHPIGATPQWEPPEPAGKDKLSMQVLPPGGGILPPVAWSAGYQPAPVPETKPKPAKPVATATNSKKVDGGGAGAYDSNEDNPEPEKSIENMTPEELKRYRRMLSNRESARRSRQRRLEMLTELEEEASRLQSQSEELKRQLDTANERCGRAAAENRALRAELLQLRSRLKDAGVTKGLSEPNDAKVPTGDHPRDAYGVAAAEKFPGMSRTASMNRVASYEHIHKKIMSDRS